jgi:hypothetical protein
MTAASTDRETVRDALTTLLTAKLVGTGKPVKAVYNYRIGDFQGQSPVVTVSSEGSLRSPAGEGADIWHNLFYLAVHTFVLYADPGTGWGEDDAEDALDDIERLIADVVMDNDDATYWGHLAFDSRSMRDDVAIGGDDYVREIVTIRAEVYE